MAVERGTIWHPEQSRPSTGETEIDTLMRRQARPWITPRGKRMSIACRRSSRAAPLICLVSPNVLVGANKALGNFRPAVLDPHTLWNVEELFWRQKRSSVTR